jgi:hypothetical protein
MFYKRPEIEPLNLDLVRLDGGGSCPSQFFGTTVDGRSLYIRYRNGWLSACGGDLDCPPGSEDEELVTARIGPAFHGDILMEQVCDLLGLTLFGTTPPFTDDDRLKAAEKSKILDWSGKTTYWEEQLQVTREGGKRFVETLKAAFYDLVILEVSWQQGRTYIKRDSVDNCKYQASVGINPDPQRLMSILNAKHTQRVDLKNAFSYVINFRFDWNNRLERDRYMNYKNVNRPFFEVFGERAVLAERSRGTVSGEFATDDPKSVVFVTRLYEVIDACFSGRAAWVDPQGTILRMFDKPSLHSRDLAEWCRRSTDHYLMWGREDFGSGQTIAGLKAL